MPPRKAIAGHNADPQGSFWTRYVSHMQAQGVKSTVVRWYVIRAEHYLRSVAQQSLEEHMPQRFLTPFFALPRVATGGRPYMREPGLWPVTHSKPYEHGPSYSSRGIAAKRARV
jgi:hypothetical protein